MTTLRVFGAVLTVAAFTLAGSVRAEMKTEWIEYAHGAKKLKAFMAYDAKITGKRPAVFIIHAREGMSEKTRRLTQMWAKDGYVAFATDIFGFGEGLLPKNVEEMQVQTKIYNGDRALMRARTQAGFDAFMKNPMVDTSKVALIGYCFGGTVGVEFGSTGAPVALNIAIHGSFNNHAQGWAKNAKGMFVILHGAEDKGFSLATSVYPVVEELRTAQVPFHLEVYSGSDHGFSTPKNKAEERADTESIATSFRIMKATFGR